MIKASESTRRTLAHEAVKLLIHTNIVHKRIAFRRAMVAGMHPSQHRMLIHLSKGGGSFAQKDIANMFDISPAAVATAMKKMEASGYITRNKHARDDARYNNVFVTEKGLREVEETSKYFEIIDSAMFEGFTEEEIAQLTSLLARANSNLQKVENQNKEG